MKRCTLCDVFKPRSEFRPREAAKDKLASWCNACHAARTRIWKNNNKKRLAEYMLIYRAANKEKLKAQTIAYRKKLYADWRKRNAAKIQAKNRDCLRVARTHKPSGYYGSGKRAQEKQILARHAMTKQELIAFTAEVSARFDAGEIHGPVHLNSETQAEPLIEIFREIKRTDWVLSTWRAHFHALLHGVPRELVMAEILAGRSMMLHFPKYRFMSSAIMGGMLPIACGLAAGGERVWCFVGDMCESAGSFKDARAYAAGHDLDVSFIVEDNGLSTNTPTVETWGPNTVRSSNQYRWYCYTRTTSHYQPLPGARGF